MSDTIEREALQSPSVMVVGDVARSVELARELDERQRAA